MSINRTPVFFHFNQMWKAAELQQEITSRKIPLRLTNATKVEESNEGKAVTISHGHLWRAWVAVNWCLTFIIGRLVTHKDERLSDLRSTLWQQMKDGTSQIYIIESETTKFNAIESFSRSGGFSFSVGNGTINTAKKTSSTYKRVNTPSSTQREAKKQALLRRLKLEDQERKRNAERHRQKLLQAEKQQQAKTQGTTVSRIPKRSTASSRSRPSTGPASQSRAPHPDTEVTRDDLLPLNQDAKPVGLPNAGNTCFMNSVLQRMARTTDFDSLLEKKLDKGDDRIDLQRRLRHIVNCLRSGVMPSNNTMADLRYDIGKTKYTWPDNSVKPLLANAANLSQQDSDEMLIALRDLFDTDIIAATQSVTTYRIISEDIPAPRTKQVASAHNAKRKVPHYDDDQSDLPPSNFAELFKQMDRREGNIERTFTIQPSIYHRVLEVSGEGSIQQKLRRREHEPDAVQEGKVETSQYEATYLLQINAQGQVVQTTTHADADKADWEFEKVEGYQYAIAVREGVHQADYTADDAPDHFELSMTMGAHTLTKADLEIECHGKKYQLDGVIWRSDQNSGTLSAARGGHYRYYQRQKDGKWTCYNDSRTTPNMSEAGMMSELKSAVRTLIYRRVD